MYLILFVTISSCTNSPMEEIPEFTSSNTGPYILNLDHLSIVSDHLDEPEYRSALDNLIEGAEFYLAKDDYQFVTDKTHMPQSGDIHDYMSLAPYFYPDSTGAYTIPRDGVRNPEVNEFDRPKLATVSIAVYSLSFAYYYEGEDKYAEKAAELIYNWFLNPQTRMNPNLNFAQVQLGVDNDMGMYQGIIDTNDFIRIIEAVGLIYDSHHWTATKHIELKEWFYMFTNWILNKYPADYSCMENSCDNVSTWFDAQKTIYFLFTEQYDRLKSEKSIQPISEKISYQFSDLGVQQFEKDRSIPQHYVYYNLRAYIKIAQMRKNIGGFDRHWQTLNSENYGGIKPALDAIVNYLNGEDVSIYFEVSSSFNDCRYLEILKPASVAFESYEYESAAQKLISGGCNDALILLASPELSMLSQ